MTKAAKKRVRKPTKLFQGLQQGLTEAHEGKGRKVTMEKPRIKLECPMCASTALAGNQEPGCYPEILACATCGWMTMSPDRIQKICERAMAEQRETP